MWRAQARTARRAMLVGRGAAWLRAAFYEAKLCRTHAKDTGEGVLTGRSSNRAWQEVVDGG